MCSKTLVRAGLAAALFAALYAAASVADAGPARGTPPRDRVLGDHPAIVVQRLARQAGYDYAAKFYPHPAWLHLRPAPAEVDTLAQAAR